MSKKVKITVLKKDFHPEFAEQFLSDGKTVGPCPLLEEGDTFIFEGSAKMPEGFCPWAWIDIYGSVSSISSGSSFTPWNRQEGQTIVCCTDGIRPVIFDIQAMEDIPAEND
ncbi:MAG TPA: TIGR04076 family protein [Lachnospiraceae bacterium]|nr:TIGR04076 family protein [Lachnospiraceae bacterium]